MGHVAHAKPHPLLRFTGDWGRYMWVLVFPRHGVRRVANVVDAGSWGYGRYGWGKICLERIYMDDQPLDVGTRIWLVGDGNRKKVVLYESDCRVPLLS